MISFDELTKLLSYDPITGVFTWNVNHGRSKIGGVAGSIDNSTGYIRIRLNKKLYYAHRLAWLYMEGYIPEHCVDHINRDRIDNRWDNLRHVTQSCNNRNVGLSKNNTSGITGVYHTGKSYAAFISEDGNPKHLGTFSTKNEAVIARYKAEMALNYNSCRVKTPAQKYVEDGFKFKR